MFLLALTNSNYMKLILNSFFLFLTFLCSSVFADEFYKKYNVKVSGIKIGELDWEVGIREESYFNKIQLESKGLLSGIYQFDGEYSSEGFVENNTLKPTKYNHLWETNKVEKYMTLAFKNEKLSSLIQKPIEKERLRVDVFNIKKTKDPLTSFLQIIMGDKKSLVVDGRRTYIMNVKLDEEVNQTIIEVSNYFNLWADHKRSKFKKIIFEKRAGDFFPSKINIYFDRRVFRLE